MFVIESEREAERLPLRLSETKPRIGEGRKTTGIISYSVAGVSPVSAVRIIRELGKTPQRRRSRKRTARGSKSSQADPPSPQSTFVLWWIVLFIGWMGKIKKEIIHREISGGIFLMTEGELKKLCGGSRGGSIVEGKRKLKNRIFTNCNFPLLSR